MSSVRKINIRNKCDIYGLQGKGKDNTPQEDKNAPSILGQGCMNQRKLGCKFLFLRDKQSTCFYLTFQDNKMDEVLGPY